MSAQSSPEGPPQSTGAPRPLHARPTVLVLVLAGGLLGTLCRWGAGRLIGAHGGWPTGTTAVNLAGAFILGCLLEALARHPDEGGRRALRLGFGTGFCGALTTYSALAMEVVLLAGEARWALALGYLCVSVLGGLGAAWAGIAVVGRSRRAGGSRR